MAPLGERGEEGIFQYGTPVNGAPAVSSFYVEGADNVEPGYSVTIGDRTYVFVEELTIPAVAYEVLIGASYADSLNALAVAINAEPGYAGIIYSANTPQNPDVSGEWTDSFMVVTARAAGAEGNGIPLSSVGEFLVTNAPATVGGVDGTPGYAGARMMDETYYYVLGVDNALGEGNWKQIAHAGF